MPYVPSAQEALEEAAQSSGDRDLFLKVAEILFRHDPVGINFEGNVDEYSPEVDTILPRLATASSNEDARRIAREEFAHWFGGAGIAKPRRLHAAADEIWQVWQASAPERLDV